MTAPGGTGPVDGRLGRRFAGHSPQNLEHLARPLLAARRVERRDTWWPMPPGPFPLDQGAEGACTGFGLAHELAAGPVQVPGVDEAYARHRYERNRAEDRAMGYDFPDGATVLATMRAAKADGIITGYRWCLGLDDVLDALCSVGPVCLGISWYSSMYATEPGGLVRVGGQLVGGHFITLVARQTHPQWGPGCWWLNTWGPTYGVARPEVGSAGLGFIRDADLARLLAEDGEAVVPADFFVAPEPEPEPAPAPVPEPTKPDRRPPRPRPGDTWWTWIRYWLWCQRNPGK